ncbi:MAG: hypothetical protein OEZ36_11285 [Spirochaetota bacterium]|nr:hypothetical protein [Spirochaetota bacterium]
MRIREICNINTLCKTAIPGLLAFTLLLSQCGDSKASQKVPSDDVQTLQDVKKLVQEANKEQQQTKSRLWLPGTQTKNFSGIKKKDLYPSIPTKYRSYQNVAFDFLAGYNYEKRPVIPQKVRALHSRHVLIEGFMLPVAVKGGKVKGFMLMRDQMMCCFGVAPKMNEWLIVQMKTPMPFYPDVPVRVFGKLTVGEKREGGMVVNLYRLEGDFIIPPKGVEAFELDDTE